MEDVLKALSQDSDNHSDDIELLKKWYLRDDNSIPAEHVLEPISVMAQGLGVNVEEAKELWVANEKRLSNVLRKGAQILVDAQKISQGYSERFSRSITNEEIEMGLLGDPDPNSHCLCFFRKFQDVNMKHPKAWRFVDVADDGEIDRNAQSMLGHMKDKIQNALSKENKFEFTVPWSDQGGINETDHAKYLDDLCVKFESSVTRLIDKHMDSQHPSAPESSDFSEVLEHSHQCVSKCERFYGREDVLDYIRDYVGSHANRPLIVHGQSGCGKTSILAKAARKVSF